MVDATAVVVRGEPPGTAGDVADRDERTRRRKIRPGLICAVGWVALVVVAAIFANVLPIENPQQVHLLSSYQGPSLAHWFGTDQLGRDQFARAIYGARVSLIVSVSATLSAAVIGGAAGVVGGYLQGITDTTIMGLMDALLAFPAFVLALALTSFLGASLRNVIIAISVLAIPVFARLTRSVTLSLARRDFIQAARSLGTPTWRILVFDLVPNLATTVISFVPVFIALAIVIAGALSFLGIGVPPPTPTWGTMISQGQSNFATYPYMSLIPAIVMFVTVFALNTVGRWLDRRFNQGGGAL